MKYHLLKSLALIVAFSALAAAQDLAAFARYRAKHPDRSWAGQVRSTALAAAAMYGLSSGTTTPGAAW